MVLTMVRLITTYIKWSNCPSTQQQRMKNYLTTSGKNLANSGTIKYDVIPFFPHLSFSFLPYLPLSVSPSLFLIVPRREKLNIHGHVSGQTIYNIFTTGNAATIQQ